MGLQVKIWRGHSWTNDIWVFFFPKFPWVFWWLARFGDPLFRDQLPSEYTLGVLYVLSSVVTPRSSWGQSESSRWCIYKGEICIFASRLILMDILIGGYCPVRRHSWWYPRVAIPPLIHLELFILWSWSTLSDVSTGTGGQAFSNISICRALLDVSHF